MVQIPIDLQSPSESNLLNQTVTELCGPNKTLLEVIDIQNYLSRFGCSQPPVSISAVRDHLIQELRAWKPHLGTLLN